MDKNRFSQLEERIQALIEGGFARLFAGRLHPRDVALRLARIMEDEAEEDPAGHLVAPNRYVVHLYPDDHAALVATHSDLPVMLAQHLLTLAQECDLRIETQPEVTLIPDQTVALHEVAVQAEHIKSARHTTQMIPVPSEADEHPASLPEDFPAAFLVIDGSRYVPLDRTVFHIGRRRDSSLVLEDRRVSRQHCQLRFRFGQFVLYDLGSRGGTFVNDERISECVLRPGDVISLAGVSLVYVVEDDTTGAISSGGGDTQINLFPFPDPANHDEDDW